MDLLDRYLQAVEFWLPRRQKKDILAELSEDIRSQVEERETELGRPLTNDELEAILTRLGHPMLMAERYLPSQALIGPLLFPAYKLVLTIISAVYLLPWLLVWIGVMIFDPDHRIGSSVWSALTAFWFMTLHIFAIVTVIFAIVERHRAKSRFWETWNAKALAGRGPVRDPNVIPRSESVMDLVVDLFMILWWVGLVGSPTTYTINAFRIMLRPMDPFFYWSILLFLVAGFVMAGVNLSRPWWTRRRAGVRLAIDAFGVVLACLLLAAGPMVEVVSQNPLVPLTELVRWANLSWYVTLAIIGMGSLARAVQSARRAIGRRPFRNWAMTALGA